MCKDDRHLAFHSAVQIRITRADLTFDVRPNFDKCGELFLPLSNLAGFKRAQAVAQQLHATIEIILTGGQRSRLATVVAVNRRLEIERLLLNFCQIHRFGFQCHTHQCHRGFDFAVVPHAGVTHDALVRQPDAVKLLIGVLQTLYVAARRRCDRLIQGFVCRLNLLFKCLAFGAVIDGVLLLLKRIQSIGQG